MNTPIIGLANNDPNIAPIGTAPIKNELTVGSTIKLPNDSSRVYEGIVERYVKENPK